jgi:hypothetical protein
MNVPTPQKAKVIDSIIRNAPISDRRTARSANKSTTVKRVSARSSLSSAAPLRRRAWAARRRSLACSQRGDPFKRRSLIAAPRSIR